MTNARSHGGKAELASGLVKAYGELFLTDSAAHGRWSQAMLYLEAYHQAALSLMVNGMHRPPGWCALSEVPWGVGKCQGAKPERLSRARTDLLFLHESFAVAPAACDWRTLAEKGVKVELKVIVTGDWSDRWHYLCSDLWYGCGKSKGKKQDKESCDFALAVIIDERKLPSGKDVWPKFGELLEIGSGNSFEPADLVGKGAEWPGRFAGRVTVLARWPVEGSRHGELTPDPLPKGKRAKQATMILALALEGK